MAAAFKVKALYEYTSVHEDDLSFGIGQIITVTDQEGDDWYEGEYVDDDGAKHEGLFPSNFVEKFEPVAPPRPARSRTKKDLEKEPEKETEAARHASETSAQPSIAAVTHEEPAPIRQTKPGPEHEEAEEPMTRTSLEKSPPPVAEPANIAESIPVGSPPQAAPKATAPAPQPAASGPTPKAKPPPPEKPVSGTFKDRIAAFNKPSAAPIAPFKPGAASAGYSKKPFVPPPPSRDAYVPVPKDKPMPPMGTYKREEDPEIKDREAENLEHAQKAGLVPAVEGGSQGDGEEEQPKPTSLRERIALLQKQQVEQAQRHADAAAKKEKPKKPPVKKRIESSSQPEVMGDLEETEAPPPPERRDTEDLGSRTSTDEGPMGQTPPPPRRKSSKGPAIPTVQDGNEADMSGAGDTTEGQDDPTEREEMESMPIQVSRAPTSSIAGTKDEDVADDDEEEEEEEEEDDDDPEAKRKEELRARMAKMSGGMGFHGMFGAPVPSAGPPPPKKKKAPRPEALVEEEDEEAKPAAVAPQPIPAMMALPARGPRKSEEVGRPDVEPEPVSRAVPPPVPSRAIEEEDDEDDDEEEEEEDAATPAPATGPHVPPRELGGAPPIPGGRPAPPPVPAETRPPPPPPRAPLETATEGSQSDDELSSSAPQTRDVRSHPRLPPLQQGVLSSEGEMFSPTSPTTGASKRMSRPPPPIPGAAPVPPPSQSRPPPPPPPGSFSRQSTKDFGIPPVPPSRPPQAGEENEEEATEYEGDYDTDIASSVPHKDALKAHARESSQEDSFLQSPGTETAHNAPPPLPGSPPPRGIPPPLPSQPPPDSMRRSQDAPRAAPPPPPPPIKDTQATPQQNDDEFSSYNYTAAGMTSSYKTPKIEEDAYFPNAPPQSPPDRRAPPPAPSARAGPRQSMDTQRPGGSRRSLDRPSMESGFIANEIDLAVQSGWWKQVNQVPPVFQGRKDIFFESEESTTTNGGTKTAVTRETFVLFQDYSQTILTATYDPYNPADVELEQRHEPPPRPLRQDQMEEFYERFGRTISDAVASKKDTVVGDGTPQGLVFELLRPFKDALRPVGTRAYGSLVYANMANASTQQNDVIRPGDILTIRNAKFQGKHGAMHAKYSMEVGRPDHVGVVAEWDGTKKKVRAWEQGRESKKVKMESFKLDDLRSGEVKIWRVMPRSWVGWNTQP